MSTKSQPGPFDGMERAKPDEPVFTLRAHDPLGSRLAHEWVRLRREEINRAFHAGEISEDKRALELIQCKEAEELAWSMADWRANEVGGTVEEEVPDKPSPSYSGNVKAADELAAKAQHDTIKAASSRLSNSVAEASDAANELLAKYGFEPERALIVTAAARIKIVADHITPKRRSYYVGQPLPDPITLEDVSSFFARDVFEAYRGLTNEEGEE